MKDDDLFDWAGKEDGMGRVDENADVDWKAVADAAALEAARTHPEITTDDVVRLIPPTVTTHNLKALGPVMRRASRAGWIRPADKPGRPCARGARHASRLMVWTSLVYQAPASIAATVR